MKTKRKAVPNKTGQAICAHGAQEVGEYTKRPKISDAGGHKCVANIGIPRLDNMCPPNVVEDRLSDLGGTNAPPCVYMLDNQNATRSRTHGVTICEPRPVGESPVINNLEHQNLARHTKGKEKMDAYMNGAVTMVARYDLPSFHPYNMLPCNGPPVQVPTVDGCLSTFEASSGNGLPSASTSVPFATADVDAATCSINAYNHASDTHGVVQFSQSGGACQPFLNENKKKEYAVQVSEVVISPDPIKKGQETSFSISAVTDKPLSEGKVVIGVAYFGWNVYSETGDLCTSLSCPVPAGDFTISYSQFLPTIAPPGSYTLTLKIQDGNKNELTCIKFDFSIGFFGFQVGLVDK